MKILLPFYDDTSLFFVARMKELLKGKDIECISYYFKNGRQEFDRISQRQMEAILPGGPDLIATSNELLSGEIEDYDAVITCKVTAELRKLVDDSSYMMRRNRPYFVAFQPGLEFTPTVGVRNRKNFDIIFLNNEKDFVEFEPSLRRRDRPNYISWGHPYFLMPKSLKEDTGGDVYFFAQAVSPNTYNGRMHMAESLRAIAIANPNRKIIIKLRNLPSENLNHVHKEDKSYMELFEDLWGQPSNIVFSTCTMKEALEKSSIVITCTSTAAMDAVSAGIPTMVYTDYVEHYLDPKAKNMYKLFSESGIVTSLRSLLELDYQRPRKSWLKRNFSEDVLSELLNRISMK